MRYIRIIIIVLAVFATMRASAQEAATGPVVKMSGFVKTDFLYDTRQTSAANGIREGHFYLFPDNALWDENHVDLNDNPAFHILNIQTRFRFDMSGPDVLGAKTTAAVETEFFGTSEADLNGFRIRHAYIQLKWEKTTFLAGQTWHPMFPAESFPGTLSFNTGAPFTPFSRNPQLRLTRHLSGADVILSAYTQRDFTSTGPDGVSNKYIRNSGLPGFDLQVKVPLGKSAFFALGGDYKSLRPELKTAKNYAANATVSSMAAYLKAKARFSPVTVSLMGVYAENATDLVMLGGYAVEEVTDTAQGMKTYANISTLSTFLDISTNAAGLNGGIFAGYSRNLGAGREVAGPYYSRGANIDHLLRFSPRVTYTEKMLTFGAELEMTTAAYGTTEKDGTVSHTKDITNYRVLLSAIYKF